jgi:hypothetical protein
MAMSIKFSTIMKTKLTHLNCDLIIPYINPSAVCHETALADNHVLAWRTIKLCFVSESVMILSAIRHPCLYSDYSKLTTAHFYFWN